MREKKEIKTSEREKDWIWKIGRESKIEEREREREREGERKVF